MSVPTESRTDEKGRIWFKNTFLPQLKEREVTVNEVIIMLARGAAKADQLPPDVRQAVEAELEQRQGGGKDKAKKKNKEDPEEDEEDDVSKSKSK